MAAREYASLEPVGDLVHDVRRVGQGEAGGEARRGNAEDRKGDRGKPGGRQAVPWTVPHRRGACHRIGQRSGHGEGGGNEKGFRG
jgi:hypothetical protein